MGARILVIDDEPQLCRALTVHLAQRGFELTAASSAEDALEALTHVRPDLMIVDLMLPGMDGIELTRTVRAASAIPVIVLSVADDERRKVEALESGADDYVTKPFGIPELAARIRSVLRRAIGAKGRDASLEYGALSLNVERREVRVSGRAIDLTPKEYELLKFMVEHAGKILTQRMLLRAVWGEGYQDQVQYLRVFVRQIRKKIEAEPSRPQFILTESGVGYRFSTDLVE